MERPRTARERARQELTREIKELALRQLAESGAADLSLRAIARELGMVSSALYRYFRSRDELLTALIVDAYDDLADALVEADEALPPDRHRERWVATCTATRTWARREPHRFHLVYGSPVPGYRAPADTVAPAERVMRAFARILDDAAAAGALESRERRKKEQRDDPDGRVDDGVPDAGLQAQLRTVGAVLAGHVPAAVLADLVAGFAELVGIVNLELAGHFVGGFEPADALFRHVVERRADTLGLPVAAS